MKTLREIARLDLFNQKTSKLLLGFSEVVRHSTPRAKSLESTLAGRASEKISRLARLGLFFSWSRVESGVFYDVALSALVSVLAR